MCLALVSHNCAFVVLFADAKLTKILLIAHVHKHWHEMNTPERLNNTHHR